MKWHLVCPCAEPDTVRDACIHVCHVRNLLLYLDPVMPAVALTVIPWPCSLTPHEEIYWVRRNFVLFYVMGLFLTFCSLIHFPVHTDPSTYISFCQSSQNWIYTYLTKSSYIAPNFAILGFWGVYHRQSHRQRVKACAAWPWGRHSHYHYHAPRIIPLNTVFTPIVCTPLIVPNAKGVVSCLQLRTPYSIKNCYSFSKWTRSRVVMRRDRPPQICIWFVLPPTLLSV